MEAKILKNYPELKDYIESDEMNIVRVLFDMSVTNKNDSLLKYLYSKQLSYFYESFFWWDPLIKPTIEFENNMVINLNLEFFSENINNLISSWIGVSRAIRIINETWEEPNIFNSIQFNNVRFSSELWKNTASATIFQHIFFKRWSKIWPSCYWKYFIYLADACWSVLLSHTFRSWNWFNLWQS